MTSTLSGILSLVLSLLDAIIPIIFGLAFIAFLWGIYQSFIAGGADEEKRTRGRQILMFGIIGFVIMFSVWSLVNIARSTLGFRSEVRPAYPTFEHGGSSGNTNTNPVFGSTPGPASSSSSKPCVYDDYPSYDLCPNGQQCEFAADAKTGDVGRCVPET